MIRIKAKGIDVVVYEPVLEDDEFYNSIVIKDLAKFEMIADTVVSNCMVDELMDVPEKIYTRDLFVSD